ncbi:MAG TPA: DNA mismatch repair protein MutS, partial [Tepidisphaeraceae bacterium]|nr:DNA mismatch repair protein MutS [Tepidisphaeraceae bacterium]
MTQTADKTGKPCGDNLSPAMRQYQQFKSQYPDYVLFFRMGDFYELFWDDARVTAKTLGLTLTSRSRGGLDAEDAIPMAGVPFHSVDGYLRKMIAQGFKVAICEQMEDPAQAKGLIRREVVRLMTPGTLTDDPLLEGSSDNFLAGVAMNLTKNDGYRVGLAWVELSTGTCCAMSADESKILDEIARINPAEIVVPENPSGQIHEISGKIRSLGINAITGRTGWQFTPHHASEQIKKQWQTASAAGFGFDDDDPAVLATAAVLSYLEETQKQSLSHIRPLRRHIADDFLAIDPASWRSLEIERTVRTGGTEGTVLSAIDRTRSPMGGRMLRSWLRFPLCDIEHITSRQSAVAALIESPEILKGLCEKIDDVCDIERIIGRIAVARVSPRDLSALGKCLHLMPSLIELLEKFDRAGEVTPELIRLRDFCKEQAGYLRSAIQPDPAPHLRDGDVIAAGFDSELDRLRQIGTNSQSWLAEFQARLITESAIPSLKIGYNKVFGYYIEVTDAHRDKVPAAWTRKQTIKNAERYITEELKKFEDEALGALEKSISLEQRLFEQIRQALLPHISQFQELADSLARLDVLCALATLAVDRRYCRPELSEDRKLEIIDGRHPVLEQQLGNDF